MELIMDILIVFFLISGVFFYFVGVVGLIRMPDVYSRMHATTKCDTLGAGLILLALMLAQPISTATAKIFFVIVFIWLTNPTAAHIIARASYKTNIPFSSDTEFVDHTSDGVKEERQ